MKGGKSSHQAPPKTAKAIQAPKISFLTKIHWLIHKNINCHLVTLRLMNDLVFSLIFSHLLFIAQRMSES